MFHLFGLSWFSWPSEARGQDTSSDGIDIQVFFYFHTKRATKMIELFSMHIGFTTSQELRIFQDIVGSIVLRYKKDNQLQNLELPGRIFYLRTQIWYKGGLW